MGANIANARMAMEWRVSIHAPVMGANEYAMNRELTLSFNPRTRDGCE